MYYFKKRNLDNRLIFACKQDFTSFNKVNNKSKLISIIDLPLLQHI